MPLLVLWGTRSGQGSGYDLLKVWRDHADEVSGQGIDSGHFIPEEKPDEVYAALKGFFTAFYPRDSPPGEGFTAFPAHFLALSSGG